MNIGSRIIFLLFLTLSAFSICSCIGQNKSKMNETEKRIKMVRDQIEWRGINNRTVLNAMKAVPRHEFVPEPYKKYAYEDSPLPIGQDQTISQPYIVAFMTDVLDLKPDDKVLEIGTGSGYQAAVLAEICDTVYTIEIFESLANRAKETLKKLHYKNVFVKHGDGYQGWKEHAPYDAIIVTCAPEEVPQALEEQLKEGGKMVIPVGEKYNQELYLLTKKDSKLKKRAILPVRFVPMIDEDGKVY